MPVIVGRIVTLLGIGIIGYAGNMKSASLSEEEKKKAVKDFNFTKGIFVALLAGFMSACFSIGLDSDRVCVSRKAQKCIKLCRLLYGNCRRFPYQHGVLFLSECKEQDMG